MLGLPDLASLLQEAWRHRTGLSCPRSGGAVPLTFQLPLTASSASLVLNGPTTSSQSPPWHLRPAAPPLVARWHWGTPTAAQCLRAAAAPATLGPSGRETIPDCNVGPKLPRRPRRHCNSSHTPAPSDESCTSSQAAVGLPHGLLAPETSSPTTGSQAAPGPSRGSPELRAAAAPASLGPTACETIPDCNGGPKLPTASLDAAAGPAVHRPQVLALIHTPPPAQQRELLVSALGYPTLVCRLPPPLPFWRGSIRGWARRVLFSLRVGSTFPRHPSLRAGLGRLPSAVALCFVPCWHHILLSFPGGSSHPPPNPLCLWASVPVPRSVACTAQLVPLLPSPGNGCCPCPPGAALMARPPKSPVLVPATFDTLQLCFLLDKPVTNFLSSLPRLGRIVAKWQSYFSLRVQFSVTSLFVTQKLP